MDTLSLLHICIYFFPLMFDLFCVFLQVLPRLFEFIIQHISNSLQCLFCSLLCLKPVFTFTIAFSSYFSQHPLYICLYVSVFVCRDACSGFIESLRSLRGHWGRNPYVILRKEFSEPWPLWVFREIFPSLADVFFPLRFSGLHCLCHDWLGRAIQDSIFQPEFGFHCLLSSLGSGSFPLPSI